MKLLLIGNYPGDQQESMRRFADLLHTQLLARGVKVELLRPPRVWNRFGSSLRGLGKWLGYADKLVMFPRLLRRTIAPPLSANSGPCIVHICDHSNAVYVRHLNGTPHLVTCHDLLAVRAALGEFPPRRTRCSGRQLQRMILAGLRRAGRVTCVSEATRRDVLRVSGRDPDQTKVAPLGLNYAYSPMPPAEARRQIATLLDRTRATASIVRQSLATTEPFRYLLHVGGNQWYKNRLGVLKMYAHLCALEAEAPRLVMVGKPFTKPMQQYIEASQLADKVVSLADCDNEALRALYSQAELLLFPSLAEGFGWPIIEAHACGCRVATTDQPPMNDVAGEAAFLLEPNDPASAAQCVKRALAEDAQARAERSKRGQENAARFSTEAMVTSYLQQYGELAGVS